MRIMDKMDIAWLAGLFEGEGSLAKNGKHFNLAIKMTDEDVIRRCKEITGTGNITGPYHSASYKKHHKPNWYWRVTNKKDIARILLAIYPLMGTRRQQTITSWTEVN